MIVGKQQNHRDLDVALTTLLDTARQKCISLERHIPQVDASLPKVKYLLLQECQLQPVKMKDSHSLEWLIIYQNSQQDCQSLWSQLGNSLRTKYKVIGAQNAKKPSHKMKKDIARDPILALQSKKTNCPTKRYKH